MLESAMEKKDAQSMASVAHSLVGTSANVSAEAINRVATRLEAAARGGDVSEAGSLIPPLREAVRQFQAALNGAHMGSGAGDGL